MPLAIIVLGGIGYLLRRRITGQAEIEDQESLKRTVKLQQLLDEQGLSLEDAKSLREQFRQGRGGMMGKRIMRSGTREIMAELGIAVVHIVMREFG